MTRLFDLGRNKLNEFLGGLMSAGLTAEHVTALLSDDALLRQWVAALADIVTVDKEPDIPLVPLWQLVEQSTSFLGDADQGPKIRIYNTLVRFLRPGIYSTDTDEFYLNDLCVYSRAGILDIQGVGEKSTSHVQEVMAHFNLHFAQPDDPTIIESQAEPGRFWPRDGIKDAYIIQLVNIHPEDTNLHYSSVITLSMFMTMDPLARRDCFSLQGIRKINSFITEHQIK